MAYLRTLLAIIIEKDCRLASWDSTPGRGRNLSLLNNIQIEFKTHPASYPVGRRALHPWVKLPGREVYHCAHCSFEVKNGEAIPPLPHTSSWLDA
jgi:hypothetical protein